VRIEGCRMRRQSEPLPEIGSLPSWGFH
jgi:hypothetical protein